MTSTIPPLPPHLLTKGHQFRLVSFPGGQKAWGLRARFQLKKHRGACAGAFGGARK